MRQGQPSEDFAAEHRPRAKKSQADLLQELLAHPAQPLRVLHALPGVAHMLQGSAGTGR